jgi:hypothetical protein
MIGLFTGGVKIYNNNNKIFSPVRLIELTGNRLDDRTL